MSQIPVFFEIIVYRKYESAVLMLMMSLFTFYKIAVIICMFSVAIFSLLTESITHNGILLLVCVIWFVIFFWPYLYLYYSNIPLPSETTPPMYSYFPTIIFLLIFELFNMNNIDPVVILKLCLLHVFFAFLFGILGGVLYIGLYITVIRPVSTDQVFWRNVWKVVAIVCILNQLINQELSYKVIIVVIVLLLFMLSNKRILTITASLLIVSVLYDTFHTYKFWIQPQDQQAAALHEFLRQFSLVGALMYVIAYEQ